MLFKRRTHHKTIISFGLALIALANLSRFFIVRQHALSENIGDSVSGFIFGIAIGTTLLGVYLGGRAVHEGKRSTQ